MAALDNVVSCRVLDSPLRKVVKAALLGASTVAMKPGWASWKPKGVAWMAARKLVRPWAASTWLTVWQQGQRPHVIWQYPACQHEV